MTEPILCGHPTPAGPCTRKVLPGAGGCGYHPAPPAPPEQRHHEPVKSSTCERSLVLAHRDGKPVRCFWCSKALPDQQPTRETAMNRDEPVDLGRRVDHVIRAAAGRRPRADGVLRDSEPENPPTSRSTQSRRQPQSMT